MPRDLLVLDAIREVRAAGVRIRCLPTRPCDAWRVESVSRVARRAMAVSVMRRSVRRGWRGS